MAELLSQNETQFDSSDDKRLTSGGGVDVDTATIVSITSSCIILISGCIAVICLIVYMKKSDSIRNNQQMSSLSVCGKCGAAVAIATPNPDATQRPQMGQSVRATTILTPLRGGFESAETTATDRQPVVESALYAISTFAEKTDDSSLLGFICGHIACPDDSQTTYSTNEIHNKPLDVRRQQATTSYSQSSSNQEELLFDNYDRNFAKGVQKTAQNRLSFESFEMIYESINGSDDNGRGDDTDSGIREFTAKPPKANERRQAVVQRLPHVETNDDNTSTTSDSEDNTPINASLEPQFGAIGRSRSRKPTWKLLDELDTIKCLSTLSQKSSTERNVGLTDNDDDDSDHSSDNPTNLSSLVRTTIDC